MRTPLCPACATPMKRNGTTSKGTTRWRCKTPQCGASRTIAHPAAKSKDPEEFLSWLFSKNTQQEASSSARTLRRHTARYWDYWPRTPLIEESHTWIHVDGIHLGRNAVVLIAVDEAGFVLGWGIPPGPRPPGHGAPCSPGSAHPGSLSATGVRASAGPCAPAGRGPGCSAACSTCSWM
jgi:hypothetical protein